MKQQEKTQKTRERILAAAIAEFGSKSYATASVNSICEAGQISKGLLYHNFKGKDELYLQCVKICYDRMTAFLKAQHVEIRDAQEILQKILLARQTFFDENPELANIFFNAVLQPPRHLLEELSQLRVEFEEYFSGCFLELLNCVTLRDGITTDTALEYFTAIWEMFNVNFRRRAEAGGGYRTLIEDHEERLSGIFDIMLYGLAKQ